MAESPNVYVKLLADGQYVEREAGAREIDHVNLRAMGFVPKGSPGAPKPKDGAVPEPANSNDLPTSVRAAQAEAEANSTGPRSSS